ncbi:MAG: hypothetical protein AAF631_11910 [Pseudomonadota bacterium]
MGITGFGKWTAVALSLVAACTPVADLVSQNDTPDATPGTRVVTVSGQDVIVGDAAGYCINDRQSRDTSNGAFVVMGPCDTDAEVRTARGLVLVNVLADAEMTRAVRDETLEGFFKSAAGRRALSAHGDGGQVRILGTMENNAAFYVHSLDEAGPVIPDTSPEQWRAFLVAGDRLVSISVVNFTDAPMSDGMIFTQLETIARAIRRLNRG